LGQDVEINIVDVYQAWHSSDEACLHDRFEISADRQEIAVSTKDI
jgi:hypothetical protein